MPKQKDLKRIVRARMEKTGESYTTARLQLVRKKEQSSIDYAALAGMADDKVKAKTGRDWREWTAVLDAADAVSKPHRDIARYISALGVPGWWTQTVTVGYERIKGLRDRLQRRGGTYEASKTKTYAVPIDVLYAAFANARRRKQWLPERLTVRSASENKAMRVALEDGTVAVVGFTAKGPSKSSVAVQHMKLADRDAVAAAKAFWSERLDTLGMMLS